MLRAVAYPTIDSSFPNAPTTLIFCAAPRSCQAGKGRSMERLHRPLATLLMLCLATTARAHDLAQVDLEALLSSRLAGIGASFAGWQAMADAGAAASSPA